MSVFDDAKTKRANRRAAGVNQHPNLPMNLQNLIQAVTGVLVNAAQGNTQSTIVIACYVPTGDYYGVGIPVALRPALAVAVPGGNLTHVSYADANLHAEMKVVRRVCNDHQVTKNNLAGNLIIACVGKPVCADCCGWMSRYGIEHGVQCSNTGSAQGWRHPFTSANFRGEQDSDFTYTKSDKYRESATRMTPDPKAW